MMSSYPSPTCPFPSAINPHAETAHHASIAWAQQHGLVHSVAEAERLRRQRPGILMARCYPHAPIAALQWISDWNTWAFVFDDQNDEAGQGRAPEQIAQFQADWFAIMRGGMPMQKRPLTLVWHDLATRLRAQASPAVWERFIQQHVDYFAACIWEAINRIQQHTPDLATYVRMRRDTSGFYICFTLIECAAQLNLPATVYAHPTVQDLTDSANNLVCWGNDIMSFEKERQHGDVHNLVIVLRHAQQRSWPEAVACAVAMYDAEVQRFQALAAQLPSFSAAVDAELQRYVAGLQFIVRGSLDWHSESSRYGLLALES